MSASNDGTPPRVPDAATATAPNRRVEPADLERRLARYVGLKEWGWYLSQLDEWMTYVHDPRPVHVLEIGAFDGVSSNLMLDLVFPHPESSLVAIDPFLLDPTTPEVGADTRNHFLENRERAGRADRIELIEALSFEALSGMEPAQFDFIYIDGSHLARHVLEDAVFAFPLLKCGGVLGFDDYGWGEGQAPHARPKPAIDAFESVYGDKLQLLFSNWQRFYRKTSD